MRLHAHEYGDPAGPPVVCLHGVTSHAQRFRRLGEGPLEARRVVAPDFRGHGHSDRSPPWSTATHASDVLDTIDALGIDRAAWLGVSFGGRVTAAVTAREPGRVERIALLDPALQLPADVCAVQAELECQPHVFASAEAAIEERLAAGTLFSTPREFLEEEASQHLEPVEGGLRYRYSAQAAIAAWGEMADQAPPIADVPTLILHGERSWLALDAHVERYRERLGDRLELATLPAGHALLWDAFAETSARLARFLETQPR